MNVPGKTDEYINIILGDKDRSDLIWGQISGLLDRHDRKWCGSVLVSGLCAVCCQTCDPGPPTESLQTPAASALSFYFPLYTFHLFLNSAEHFPAFKNHILSLKFTELIGWFESVVHISAGHSILIDPDWCWLILIDPEWYWLILNNSVWSWMILIDRELVLHVVCYIRFATRDRNALLLYNGRFNQKHDFIALEIINEQIQLTFSAGRNSSSLLPSSSSSPFFSWVLFICLLSLVLKVIVTVSFIHLLFNFSLQ